MAQTCAGQVIKVFYKINTIINAKKEKEQDRHEIKQVRICMKAQKSILIPQICEGLIPTLTTLYVDLCDITYLYFIVHS